jgi:hypothetical protein
MVKMVQLVSVGDVSISVVAKVTEVFRISVVHLPAISIPRQLPIVRVFTITKQSIYLPNLILTGSISAIHGVRVIAVEAEGFGVFLFLLGQGLCFSFSNRSAAVEVVSCKLLLTF